MLIAFLLVTPVTLALGQYLYLIDNDVSTQAWIQVNQDVSHNATGDYWALTLQGGAPPTYENFTAPGWVEVVGGKLSQTASRATWEDLLRTDEGQLDYSNRGTLDSLGGSAYFKLNVSEITTNYDGTTLMYPILFVEGSNYPDWNHILAGNYDSFGLRLRADNGQGVDYCLYIAETIDGDTFATGMADLGAMTVGAEYWVNLTKSGDLITCSVYEDAWITLVETWTHTLDGGAGNMNDLYVTVGHDASANPRSSSGYVEDLTFEEGGSGYPSPGYLYTEDLLGNTTMGPAYTFCTGQVVPTGATLSVAFSEDNSTWVRSTSLSTTAGNLRESIFLEDLNYTALYVRFTFTSEGQTTPELNHMDMAYMIEDPGEGANGWIYALCASPLMLAVGLVLKAGIPGLTG